MKIERGDRVGKREMRREKDVLRFVDFLSLEDQKVRLVRGCCGVERKKR